MELLDLSTPIDWENSVPQPPFVAERGLSEIRATNTFEDSAFIDSEFTLSSHAGTHVVSPMMVFSKTEKKGIYAINDIPLEQFYGWTAVLDIPKGELEPITVHDLDRASRALKIIPGDIVLVHTHWGKYFVADPKNGYYLYNKHPGLDVESAEWLIGKKIKAYGQDTMGIQCGKYSLFPSEDEKEQGVIKHHEPIHRLLLQNDILIIEQLYNLDKIAGRRLICGFFPLPFTELEASPIRAVAFLDI